MTGAFLRPWRRRMVRALSPIDPWLARKGLAASRRLDPYRPHQLSLEAPPAAEPGPRYGWGRPRHARLEDYLQRYRSAYAEALTGLMAYESELMAIPLEAASGQPCWINPWLPGLDTASLYGLVRSWAPATYFEIGSGCSTLVVARARSDGGLATRIVSVDPQPRHDVDDVCDHVERSPFELVAHRLLAEVGPGDMVFVDSSHRVFTGSDAAVFYLEVLPELPDGVLVGIHDILWPDDYLPEWTQYWWSEQYLLGAYLLAEASWIQPVLACRYASTDTELAALVAPLWEQLAGVDRRGFAFWFKMQR